MQVTEKPLPTAKHNTWLNIAHMLTAILRMRIELDQDRKLNSGLEKTYYLNKKSVNYLYGTFYCFQTSNLCYLN